MLSNGRPVLNGEARRRFVSTEWFGVFVCMISSVGGEDYDHSILRLTRIDRAVCSSSLPSVVPACRKGDRRLHMYGSRLVDPTIGQLKVATGQQQGKFCRCNLKAETSYFIRPDIRTHTKTFNRGGECLEM